MTDPGPGRFGRDWRRCYRGADPATGSKRKDPTITSQDVLVNLGQFTRQIQITNVANNPNVRQITVTVRYPVRRKAGFTPYQVQSLISSYR